MRPIRDKIWQLGHNVVSTWIDESSKPLAMPQRDFDKKTAFKDLCEVSLAELVIMDLESVSTGKAVELGFALAQHQNKMIWTVGKEDHIFHTLADRNFRTWDEYFTELGKE